MSVLNEEFEMAEEIDIPVEKLIPLELPLRRMTDEQFNFLCQSIRENRFNERIRVVRYGEKYRIVDGMHRFEALTKVFNMKVIPCVVIGENWSEERFWSEAIRLNNLRGDFDPVILADKINELRKHYDVDELRRRLGFSSKDAFFRKVISDVSRGLPPEIRRRLAETRREISTVEDLSIVLNEIFKKYGRELRSNIACFVYGGKEVMIVRCDGELWGLLTALKQEILSKGLDASDVFKAMVRERLMGGGEG